MTRNIRNIRNFAAREGMTVKQVTKMLRLFDERAEAATHECNGDPHPDGGDKNANSQAWGKEVATTDDIILSFALRCGFTDVDFGVGLYPVLNKNGIDVYLPD